MTHVSCLSYPNTIIEDKRTDQSKISVKLFGVSLEREIYSM
jgi:hypothetical protein